MSHAHATKVERHYCPREVAPLLGLKSENEVLKCIRAGAIVARRRVLRGTGAKPRWIVSESEIRRILDAHGTNTETPTNAVTEYTPEPRARGRRFKPTESSDWV